MKKEWLDQYVKSRLKSVERHLHAFTKDGNEEHLHQLRLDIKKVKAIHAFIKDSGKKKFSIHKLKPAFDSAGKIREIQMNIRILGMLPHSSEDLLSQLKKKVDTLHLQFTKESGRLEKKVKRLASTISLPGKFGEKELVHFVKKEIKKTTKKFQRGNKQDMHPLRKRLKKVMYVYSAFPKKIQETIQVNKTYIDELQKKIGDWHDTFAAIDFLTHQRFLINMGKHLSELREKEKKQFNALFDNRRAFIGSV